MNINKVRVNTIYNSFEIITKGSYGGKVGVEGELRVWGNPPKMFQKQGKKWIYVGNPSTKNYRQACELNTIQFEELDNLSWDEKHVVMRYTNRLYKSVNKYLRQKEVLSSVLLEDLEVDIKNLSNGLNKLVSYEGPVYRGKGFLSKLEFEERIKTIEEGNIYIDKGFLSTSQNFFTGTEFTHGFKYRILYKINSKSGKPLGTQTYHEDENEVLFNKNSKFICEKKFIKELEEGESFSKWGRMIIGGEDKVTYCLITMTEV